MDINQLFKIIIHNKTSMTEMEMVMEIQKFTKTDFQRSATGYKMMRSQGIINKIVDKSTIGTIDKIMRNEKMISIIETFDGQITNANIGTENIIPKKSNEYMPDELIPKRNWTPNDVKKWLLTDHNQTTST